jgi:heptosyltransferase-2
MPGHPKRILIVGPSWIGDMVMAQSLFKLLHKQHPQAHIEVLAPAWSRPLLERMPEVALTIDLPFSHGELALGKRLKLGRELATQGYDQAIVLPNSFKSALPLWWAGIRQRTGWLGEMRYGLLNDWRKLDKAAIPMMVQRFAALAYPKGQAVLTSIPKPRLTVKVSQVQAALVALGLSRNTKPLLALCPGAEFGPAKQWPIEHYSELARRHLERGGEVWVFGSDKDKPLGEEICAKAGDGAQNLAGRTTLAEAVDLLSLASQVVTNDSGLMHVAAALGKPLVAIYGSTDPGYTPPLSDKARVVSLGLDCAPCFKRECPKGHLKCLSDISVHQVQTTLFQLGS